MSNLNFVESYLSGLYVIEGEQGRFNEIDILTNIFDYKTFIINGLDIQLIREAEIKLKKGALRGLYFQRGKDTSKLVRVTTGEVYFVAVDLRDDKPTFGKYYGIVLSEENRKQLYIPNQFAYGMLATSDNCAINFKLKDADFSPEKNGIIWNDRELNIEWLLGKAGNISILRQDQRWPAFNIVAKLIKNKTI